MIELKKSVEGVIRYSKIRKKIEDEKILGYLGIELK